MSLYKIDEIMKNNMTTQVSVSPNELVHQMVKSPIETVIVNPNSHDFFIPLNIPYIMQKCDEGDDVLGFNIEDNKENKELSIYEMYKELKKYLFTSDGIMGERPENEGI